MLAHLLNMPPRPFAYNSDLDTRLTISGSAKMHMVVII